MSCIVAWRRGCFESYYRNNRSPASVLNERIDLLGLYANAAGGADPFTAQMLQVSVGELPESWFLDALFRLETAVSVAWAVGLVESIPANDQPADHKILGGFFPTDGTPSASLRDAKLRAQPELAQTLTEWTGITANALERRDSCPEDEGAGILFSRAFERTRGLVWVCSDAQWIEDAVMDDFVPQQPLD